MSRATEYNLPFLTCSPLMSGVGSRAGGQVLAIKAGTVTRADSGFRNQAGSCSRWWPSWPTEPLRKLTALCCRWPVGKSDQSSLLVV
jgi:hypothetical protein